MGEDWGAAVRLGVDIGGSGVKAAPVDLLRGTFAAERFRISTPDPSTPQAVADVVAKLVEHFEWTGPIGTTFPAVVQNGAARTAANVDEGWVDCDVAALFTQSTGCDFTVVNDADAAGLAELEFGAAREQPGVVLLLTLGTGIGSALLVDGVLVPNTELGHLDVRGKSAETRASDRVREDKDLGWEEWAERLSDVLREYERLLWPDLIVLGGGVSKKADKFIPLLDVRTPVVPAELRNEAGIVGAALASARQRHFHVS
ncbi:MAG: polyphosphate--glucose phosphotransferase [Acidimicrobiia bacterium]